jgi:hypothetical protein
MVNSINLRTLRIFSKNEIKVLCHHISIIAHTEKGWSWITVQSDTDQGCPAIPSNLAVDHKSVLGPYTLKQHGAPRLPPQRRTLPPLMPSVRLWRVEAVFYRLQHFAD